MFVFLHVFADHLLLRSLGLIFVERGAVQESIDSRDYVRSKPKEYTYGNLLVATGFKWDYTFYTRGSFGT